MARLMSLTAAVLLALCMSGGLPLARGGLRGTTLVSYAYFEKDDLQRDNFDFFITVGMGLGGHARGKGRFSPPRDTHFIITVNGDVCTPCERLKPLLRTVDMTLPSVRALARSAQVALLWRESNEGMDIAAHNTTIEYIAVSNEPRHYRYFMFINSSARGPFYPSYMPDSWQWPDAFLRFLNKDIKAVSTSIVCLPHIDAGGPGPKLESWAFAVDLHGLEVLVQAGVFHVRSCKLCTDANGVVVNGEYGITTSLFARGYGVATLLSKYDPEVDWRDKRHWGCNNNVHPSRHATYDGIDMHPFETVFVKSSWHVGEPFTSKYSEWIQARVTGHSTDGYFDERTYFYGVSEEAQRPTDMQKCYAIEALPPPAAN